MSSMRASVESLPPDVEHEEVLRSLLDEISIKSYTQGRIRVHLGFDGDEILSDTLRRELQKLESVKLETYSVRTRNALITFDPMQASDVEVMSALMKGVIEFERVHGECDLEHHHHGEHDGHNHQVEPEYDYNESDDRVHEEEDCEHDHSATATDAGIRKELLKLAITGGLLGFFVFKKLKGKPLLFAANPLLNVASLVTIASGYSIFRAGVNSVQNQKKATDDTLISIAVISTILMGESITGLSVVWLINLGRLLEAITLKRSRTAIKDLMDIAPKEAWLVSPTANNDVLSTAIERVPVESIKKHQIIRVLNSEKIPLDGKVIRGSALVKEAFITGEPIPKEKTAGEIVYAGSLIEHGEIDIEVTNLVHETVVAHMIHAIENARDTKAPIEKVGNRFASQFIPVSIGIAGITLLLTGDLRRAITMLVIACPCAAGLATPTAVSASIGQAARKGILIKGGTHIEAAARINTIIFDKTGTLTMGAPTLNNFLATDIGKLLSDEECLRIAASAEQYTTHPLGMVLVKEAKKRGLTLSKIEVQKIHPGLGIFAEVDGRIVHIGNRRFMDSVDITVTRQFEDSSNRGFIAGESILYFSIDRVLQGAFIVQDEVRPEAQELLARLKELGIKRVLLATGDQKLAALHVARNLGISEVHAELLPKDKLDLVNDLKSRGLHVAMVGDGINDAQALAAADLSIAMGGGRCDIAIETADVTLARNDLRLVAETLNISQKTLKAIYQNFTAAVGINAGGLVFSAAGKLSPFSAAIVHNASTIAVVLNSLRLGRSVAGGNPLKILREVKI